MNPSDWFESHFQENLVPEYLITKVSEKTFIRYQNVLDLNKEFYKNWENWDENENLSEGEKVAHEWTKVFKIENHIS